MNLENFDKASKLVDRINKVQKLLDDLETDCLDVKIYKKGYSLVDIETKILSEHECAAIGKEFVDSIRKHYEAERKKLIAELETL